LEDSPAFSFFFDGPFILAWLLTYACFIGWRYRQKKQLRAPLLLLNAVWATLLSPFVYVLLFSLGFFLFIPFLFLCAVAIALLIFGGPIAIQHKLRQGATLNIDPHGPLIGGTTIIASIKFERQDFTGREVLFGLYENENTTDNPARFRQFEKHETVNVRREASCSFELPSDAGTFERRIWRLFVKVKGFPLAPETLDLPVADESGYIEEARF
jgi:hypothetical protein